MRALAKILVGLVAVVVVLIVGAVVTASVVDVNQYRDRIASALSEQTGRSVKLNGPIHLAFSLHGIGVKVQDVEIGNPSWASRPQMASIGSLQLGVSLMPLIDKQLVITELDIDKADIQLETNAGDQHNWDMKPASGAPAPTVAKKGATPVAASPAASGSPVGLRVNELAITGSQLAIRGKDGKTSTLKLDKLTLAPEGKGLGIAVNAQFNDQAIKIALKTGTADLMGETKWPYNAEITYGKYHVTAQGTADTKAKTIDLNPYSVTAGGSALHGQLMANAGGAKTEVRGTIMGDKLDPADFKAPETAADEQANATAAKQVETAPGQSKPLFSNAPLDLSALKSADANIDINIGEIVAGTGSLKGVTGKIALANGTLNIAPFKATLGDSALAGDVKLVAGPPAQYTVSFKAPGVDIGNLLTMMGTRQFLTGKGDADIELSGSGGSLHDMASTTNGHILVTADGGTISASEAGGVASGLGQLLAPGSGNPVLTCMATRFNVTNGVGKDNGMLMDSSASTVAGSGGFNLGQESVDLKFNAKPKLVNTKGFMPAVLVSGPLAAPKIGIDAAGEATNVASTLLKGKTSGMLGGLLGSVGGSGGAEATVPALNTEAPKNTNACLYTLDHKAAASTAATPASGNTGVKDVAGQATQKAKGLGNQLMQGILGH